MARRNATAEVFGTAVTDHGKAFGAGASLGAIQGPISSSLGEGVLPVVKDWTPDNRTAILSPLEPLPQKQIWGL